MKTAILLIALGFGYKVFADASKEAGALKAAGRLIGLIMITVSLLIGVYKIGKCAGLAGFCPKGMKAACASSAACPMMK